MQERDITIKQEKNGIEVFWYVMCVVRHVLGMTCSLGMAIAHSSSMQGRDTPIKQGKNGIEVFWYVMCVVRHVLA